MSLKLKKTDYDISLILYTFNLKLIDFLKSKHKKNLLLLFHGPIPTANYEKKTLKFGQFFSTLMGRFFDFFLKGLKFVYVFFQMSLILPNLSKNFRF